MEFSSGGLSQSDIIPEDLKVVNSLEHVTGIDSVYSNDTLKSTCQRTDGPVEGTSLPLYLFSSGENASGDETEKFSCSHPKDDQQVTSVSHRDLKNGVEPAPTFSSLGIDLQLPFSFQQTQQESLMTIQPATSISTDLNGTTPSKPVNDTSTELSEEMIRSFVVGGSSLPKRSQDTANKESVRTEEATPPLVTAIISTDNLHTVNDVSTQEKQVIILTEDADEEENDLMDLEEDPSTSNVMMINGSVDNEILVTLINNKSDIGVGHQTEGHKSDMLAVSTFLSAEEILRNQPDLDMKFEVVKEIADIKGILKCREITTQTKPMRRPRNSRKRKADNVSSQNTGLPLEIKNSQPDLEATDNMDDYKAHKCPRCGLKFASLDILYTHSKCHTLLDKEYKCYQCDFTATHWVKMYHHLFSHGVEKPHKCSQCQFSCVNKSDLSAHMFVHSKTKKWTCNKCKRLFKHRRNMVAHFRVCPGVDSSGNVKNIDHEVKFICEVCKKQLSNKRNLDKHMEIHQDIKPFVCDLCGHSTRLKESLVMHKRLHTGEKPFKCDQCEYSTPDKSSLRRHKRRHTNEKPYCCLYCDYKSIQKHCLDTHVRRKHTGEQFVCGICQYTTPDRYALNQHFKRHQTNIIEEPAITDAEGSTAISTSSNLLFRIEKVPSDAKPCNDFLEDIIKPDQIQNLCDVGSPEESNTNDQRIIELGTQEGLILQQIQEPGDFIFLQESGEIVIKKQDGRILIIQQQEEESEVSIKPIQAAIANT